jgi:hypothetical protein
LNDSPPECETSTSLAYSTRLETGDSGAAPDVSTFLLFTSMSDAAVREGASERTRCKIDDLVVCFDALAAAAREEEARRMSMRLKTRSRENTECKFHSCETAEPLILAPTLHLPAAPLQQSEREGERMYNIWIDTSEEDQHRGALHQREQARWRLPGERSTSNPQITGR